MVAKAFKRAILGAILVVILALAAGCARSNEVQVGDDHNGQKVSVKSSQLLAVRLEANPTTGYGWEVAEIDAAILQSQGEAVYEQANQNQKLVGGGGWQTFRFKPVKAGEARLKLVYRRSWEKDVEPIKTYEVQVTVE
jgi:inhibitor of cysteine peptidase